MTARDARAYTLSNVMTGMDLKLKRVALRVKARDVALAIGVSRGRLSAVEGLERVTPAMQKRYLDALETLSHVPNVEVAV